MLRITENNNFLYEPDGAVLTDFFWNRDKFCSIRGPIGSGTSSASCMKIWCMACEQEPDYDGARRSRWIITRDTYKELRETTVKTWLDWFPEEKWGPMIRSEPLFHHLKEDHPSGDGTRVDCEVIFLAIPDRDVAEQVCASYEITGFFRNEGQFVDKEVIDELLSRCGRYPSMKNGPGATWFGGWMDMNAPVEGHWEPYMRGDVPLPPEMTDDERLAYEKPDNWTFMVQPPGLLERIEGGKVIYSRNPLAENQKNLKETYLEKIQGKNRKWIDRRVMNKIGLRQDGKPVYPTFDDSAHISEKEVEPVKGLPIVVGLDGGRYPAAIFCQNINGCWHVLSELSRDGISAALFAPMVKRHAAQRYAGFEIEFWGDPRMLDRNQSVEITTGDVFKKFGMTIMPATSDNDTGTRRSTVESVLERRNGLKVNPSCLVIKRGLAGGYHFAKIKGQPGMFSPRPVKNSYSHSVEAFENAMIGGGEGTALIANHETRDRPKPSPVFRKKRSLRRAYG